jgi:hypothetical protein
MSDEQRYSGRGDIVETLEAIDETLEREATVYLLGGGAMTLDGLKPATKDIDLLTPTNDDYRCIRETLLDLGFEPVEHTEPDYASMGATSVLEYNDGHIDLFDRQVMSKLSLSAGMEDRSESVFEGERLDVHRLSWVDITLFKSMTPREDDRNDVSALLARGIDFGILAEEIDDQLPLNYGVDEYEWIAQEAKKHPIFQLESTFTKLEGLPNDLVEKVRRLADIVDAERELFYELRGAGSVRRDSFIDDFAAESRSTEPQLQEALERLETKGLVRIADEQVVFETDPL